LVARKQRDKEHDGEGQVTQHRHGLQHVQQRYQHHFCASALGRERRIAEGKEQRARSAANIRKMVRSV